MANPNTGDTVHGAILGTYREAVKAAREVFRTSGANAKYRAFVAASKAVSDRALAVRDKFGKAYPEAAEFFNPAGDAHKSWVSEAVLCASHWHNVPADFGKAPCDFTYLPDEFFSRHVTAVRGENARKLYFLIAAMTALTGTCALSYFTISKTLRISYDAAIKAVDSLSRQKKVIISDFWRGHSSPTMTLSYRCGFLWRDMRLYELYGLDIDGEAYRDSASTIAPNGDPRQQLILSNVMYDFDITYWTAFGQAFATPEEVLANVTLRGRRELAELCRVLAPKKPVPLYATELREVEHLAVSVREVGEDVAAAMFPEGEQAEAPCDIPVELLSFTDAHMPVRHLSAAPVHGRNRRTRAWLKLHARTGPDPGW